MWMMTVFLILCGILFEYEMRRQRVKNLRGRRVLITGGGSGLGRELSLQFARLNCIVVVLDIDHEKLLQLEREIKQEGGIIYMYVCDISKKENIHAIVRTIREDVGTIDILINNAGIVHGKSLLQLSEQEIQNSFDVNVLSHFWAVKAFLPGMIELKYGHIVAICSILGSSGQPFLTDYSSTKFAVYGFIESLRRELKQQKITGIGTTIVLPSKISTDMFFGVKQHPLVVELDASYVAQCVIHSVAQNSPTLYIPWLLHAFPFLKLLPTWVEDCILDMFGVTRAMETFKGKKPKNGSF